jgi:hypothetical protein
MPVTYRATPIPTTRGCHRGPDLPSLGLSGTMSRTFRWISGDLLGFERRMMRFLLPISAWLSLLGAAGCHQTSTLVGALVYQGLGRPGESGLPNAWTFRGLDAGTPPRIRPACYASATYGVRFIGPDDVGSHPYWLDGAEGNGILYTCGGGHIDLAHVRKAADWTGFLAALTLGHFHAGQTTFAFKLREPSRYIVELTYPQGWDSLPADDKERVARDVSRQLGQYLAYTATTWHEMLTWFGFKPSGYKSEFESVFSREDSYSNLLGTCVAAAALQDQEHTFSDAVTLALRRRLESLGVQPAAVAKQASETVRGDWYSKRWFFTVIHKRNLDIGVEDGRVTPCLVRSLPACEGAQACPLPVPALDALSQYGFSATVTIEPRVCEANRIFKALYSDRQPIRRRLDPSIHFAPLIHHIKQDASNRRHFSTSGANLNGAPG